MRMQDLKPNLHEAVAMEEVVFSSNELDSTNDPSLTYSIFAQNLAGKEHRFHIRVKANKQDERTRGKIRSFL